MDEQMEELLEKILESRKDKLPSNIRGLLERVHGDKPADQWEWLDMYEAEMNGEDIQTQGED